MNKFLKLPLFLGLVGGICTAVLATVYGITNPIIIDRAEQERLAGYLGAFGLDENSGAKAKELELSSDLSTTNYSYTMKVEVSLNGEALGIVYDGTAKGRNGDINFQVSFKEGKYNSFATVGDHSENAGYPGPELLKVLGEKLNGLDVNYFADASQFYNNSDFISKPTSQTMANVFPAIIAAANDYAASL